MVDSIIGAPGTACVCVTESDKGEERSCLL